MGIRRGRPGVADGMKLSDFEGDWAIKRRIRNAIGADAQFSGTASFSRDGEGLILSEAGEMKIDGVLMQAARRYFWRQGKAGIEVYFEDGRFFHLIGGGQRVQAHHDCAPDIYDVCYDFSGWPEWGSVWNVTGPRKDYRMETAYSPGAI